MTVKRDSTSDTGSVATMRPRHADAPVLTDPIEQRCRRVARIWTVGTIGLFLGLTVWLGVPGAGPYVPWQTIASGVIVLVSAAGLLVAVRWEGLGGSIAFVGGVSLGVLAVVEYHPLLGLGAALTFVVPAVLLLVAWQRTRTLLSVLVLAAAVGVVMLVGGVAAWSFYDAGFGPTHPDSSAPPLPDSPVAWIWSGDVTSGGAVVIAEIPEGDDVRLRVEPSDPTATAPAREVEGTGTAPIRRFDIDGLDPGVSYRYAVSVDGVVDGAMTGRFTTFAEGPQRLVVGLGSCARLGSNGAVYDAIAAESPDLFISPGDFFYGDIVSDSVEGFRDAFRTTLTQPGQSALYRSVPIAYVWDDHDYGPNDAGADSPSRTAALAAYRELVPHYELALDGPDAPIAQSFVLGRVRFVLTDLRSARSAKDMADGPDKSMLGADQLAWFEDELLAASSEGQLVLWVSSLPWIGPATPGADDWTGYAWEREHIGRFVAANGIDDILMVAGDAHMVAIDDGTHSAYAGTGSGFPVMHAGALDRPGSVKGGPFSEGVHPGGGQYGVMTVTDDGGPEITVDLVGRDWTGATLVSYRATFDLGASS